MKSTDPSIGRSARWRRAALAVLLLLAAATVTAQAVPPRHAEPGMRGDRVDDRGRPPAPGSGSYYPPEIQVFADPGSEHWPANYLPDSHRLDGYDGAPDQPTVCAGASGRSWSTRSRDCPAGQQPTTPARQWSTSP